MIGGEPREALSVQIARCDEPKQATFTFRTYGFVDIYGLFFLSCIVFFMNQYEIEANRFQTNNEWKHLFVIVMTF